MFLNVLIAVVKLKACQKLSDDFMEGLLLLHSLHT